MNEIADLVTYVYAQLLLDTTAHSAGNFYEVHLIWHILHLFFYIKFCGINQKKKPNLHQTLFSKYLIILASRVVTLRVFLKILFQIAIPFFPQGFNYHNISSQTHIYAEKSLSVYEDWFLQNILLFFRVIAIIN